MMSIEARIPRAEHPRPDLYRSLDSGWANLNGEWEFRFDPEGVGEGEEWHEAQKEGFDRRIVVPFCWESHAAWGTEAAAGNENWFSKEAYRDPGAVTRENYREAARQTVGWYRRRAALPCGEGERVFLHIGAADWSVKVWVNGVFVAEGDSGYVPFSCDVTEAAGGAAEAVIVIRVEDPQGTQDKPLGKQHAWYTTTSGIWQTVWLERRPARHVTRVEVRPGPAEAGPSGAWAEVRVEANVEGLGYRVVVTDEEGGGVAATLGEAGCGGGASLEVRPTRVEVRQGRWWSPETPHLYGVRVELLDGDEVLDVVHSYFGLRSVGTLHLREGGPKYISLNGKPIYLRAALDQSFNPWGVYTFPTEESIVRDLELAKEAGFNCLRIHIKPEDPRFLYHADRLGMLIMYDLPNLGYDGYGEVGNERWEWTFRRCVERDFNHPCIFAWVLFNETWGLGFKEYKDATDRQEWVKSMYRLAKELDPTRLIEDNSACSYDHVLTDLNSWHFYINDYEQAREHVAKVVEETYSGSEFNYVGGNKQGDEPLLNSEYGGISAQMGDMDVSWCFKFLTDLLRREEKVCGYVYTEFQDIEWEYNGIHDYDRGRKEFGYSVAGLQGPVYLGFDCAPGQTVTPGAEVRLPMFISRVGYRGQVEELTYRVTGVDSLGEEFTVVPITPVALDLAHEAELARFELPALSVPERACLLLVEAHLGRQAANWCYLEAREGRLPAQERLEDGRVVLRKPAGDAEVSTAWHEAEVERGVVDYETHLLGGIEAGHMDYKFVLPEEVKDIKSLTLVFEASSKRQGAPQTSEEKWPSDLRTWVNGVVVDERTLGDQAADSRGALSHMHGLRGRYGELLKVEVAGEKLDEVMRGGRELAVRLEVPRSGLNHRGLVVYGARAGRWPVDVTVAVEG